MTTTPNLKIGKENISSVCVLTNGCPENQLDSARYERFFTQNGWTSTPDFSKADIILFNACALTQVMEDRSLAIIKEVETKKRPQAEFMVCGCLPKINKGRLQQFFKGLAFDSEEEASVLEGLCSGPVKFDDVQANSLHSVFRSSDFSINRLKPLIGRISTPKELRCSALMFLAKQLKSRTAKKLSVIDHDAFYVKTSTGCKNNCTYCGVKLSRGHIKSKSISEIVNEIKQGQDQGYKKFGLIGTDLGSYGADINCDLIDLCREVSTLPNGFKLKLRNIHPNLIIQNFDRFKEVLDYGFIEWICSAIQAGNNRIISLMKRGYTVDDCISVFGAIKKKYPQVSLKTQLIVGFPSETEAEFEDSLNLLDQVKFDAVEIYMYQPRPGTEAAGMEGQISQEVALNRCYRMHKKVLFN